MDKKKRNIEQENVTKKPDTEGLDQEGLDVARSSISSGDNGTSSPFPDPEEQLIIRPLSAEDTSTNDPNDDDTDDGFDALR